MTAIMILKKVYLLLFSKKIQKSKLILSKKLSTVIREKEFYELNYEINELKKYLSFKYKKILDIGCGTGKFLIFCALYEKPQLCVGLDPATGRGSNEKVIQIFKDNIKRLNTRNINIIKKSIWDFETKNLKYDIITANFSLHHIIPTSKNLLRDVSYKKKHRELFFKIFNILEEDGIFIIKEVSKYHLSRYWQFYSKMIGNSNINWRTKHNSKEYIRILKDCGFQIIYKYYKVPYIFNKFRGCLSNQFASFFFDNTYFIIARKS